jgi:uncharacterized protein
MSDKYSNLKETADSSVFSQWQKVDAEIISFTDLGAKVAINEEYTGLAYGNQMFDDYQVGQKLDAYIRLVRDDGKIDISFQTKQGHLVFLTADKILKHLLANDGKSLLNDKSSPEDIKNSFKVSKTVFKQAIGRLYRQHKIIITDEGISLVES